MDRIERKVLSILKRGGGQRLTLKEIQGHMGSGRERAAVIKRLAHLVSRGKIVKGDDGKFALTSARRRMQGRFEPVNERFGFVIPLEAGGDDIYVPANGFGGAIDGDVVEVTYTKRQRGRTSGRVIRIVKRSMKEIVGKFLKTSKGTFLDPLSAKIFHEIVVANNEVGPIEDGLVVNASILKIDDRAGKMLVSITEVWGHPDDPEVLQRIIVSKFDIPTSFSAEALDEATRVPAEIAKSDISGRTDHRGLITFTIDGEQARDFDDAVSIKRTERGFRLYVHIADVGKYVAPGSALDKDAYERATSVYFPGSVIPMLPFELSNEICSLKPNVERLTLSVRMDFSKRGAITSTKVYESVIRSNARLTYSEVAMLLENRDNGEPPADEISGFASDIFAMNDLAQALAKIRTARGSLDFDLPDPIVILNLKGKPEDIVRAERNAAHRLIEEFMIVANEAVASYLTGGGAQCVYRVHEPPDEESLLKLSRMLKVIGHKTSLVGGDVSENLQRLVDKVRGKRVEKLVSYLILRSLMLAKYSPDNLGHFGLGSDCYAHFTSPIRRYPDLMVHRFIKQRLQSQKTEKKKMPAESLLEAAHHCSERGRAAEKAEKQIVKMRQAQFMADKTGETFTGIISGVISRGFFVELDKYFVEGLVATASLTDDRYSFDEDALSLTGAKTGRRFRFGDTVKVRLHAVQVPLGRIDFLLAKQKGKKAE
ncbi:ribonuclease R [bacterium]|nr:ribonuclease R [bacterium]